MKRPFPFFFKTEKTLYTCWESDALTLEMAPDIKRLEIKGGSFARFDFDELVIIGNS